MSDCHLQAVEHKLHLSQVRRQMNRLSLMVVFFLVGFSTLGCGPGPTWDKSDETSVRALFAQYESDWNRHDTKAMGELFTDDAEWVNVVGMHWRGKPDIVRAHEVYHRLLFPRTNIKFNNIAIRPIAPNVAVAVIDEDFAASLLPDGGMRPASKDILSFVLVKRDGNWKVAHGHNTIVRPDAQPYDPINSGWNGGPAK
jgi:uncharacterized protein (TIGR02246 family)